MTYLLLYKGPTPPADATHEGWPEWFTSLGDKLVDRGSGLPNGVSILPDGTRSESQIELNGYSVISADSLDELQELAANHPYLKLGSDYTIQAFEAPNK